MALYRVKTGLYHGQYNEYGPGATLELTDAEVSAFGDKFDLVVEAEPAKGDGEQQKPEGFDLSDVTFSFDGPPIKMTAVSDDGARTELSQDKKEAVAVPVENIEVDEDTEDDKADGEKPTAKTKKSKQGK